MQSGTNLLTFQRNVAEGLTSSFTATSDLESKLLYRITLTTGFVHHTVLLEVMKKSGQKILIKPGIVVFVAKFPFLD
jgi:hypothetical protein